jgi:hypothetical protein
MPHVTIPTGIVGPDGREETLSEYLCDWPGCVNVATQVLGGSKELGRFFVTCDEHGPERRSRPDSAER